MSAKSIMQRLSGTILISLAFISCSGELGKRDSYIEKEDWSGLLEYVDGAGKLRAKDIAYINIALASEGRLAEDAFSYIQIGPDGLFPQWQKLPYEGRILANIFYQAGHVSLARRMAFESDVCCAPKHDGNMIKILVKTNLIYGNWKIAEKYICLLERDGGKNAAWATSQRRFLDNMEAVLADDEYGPRSKCIPEENFIIYRRGYDVDLRDIIKANPTFSNAVDILGVYYLLSLDFDDFKPFLDEYAGTETLSSLPRSFAEAACMMSEINPGYWKSVGVSTDTFRRYTDFKKRLASGLSTEEYNDTYWVYVMRMNAE